MIRTPLREVTVGLKSDVVRAAPAGSLSIGMSKWSAHQCRKNLVLLPGGVPPTGPIELRHGFSDCALVGRPREEGVADLLLPGRPATYRVVELKATLVDCNTGKAWHRFLLVRVRICERLWGPLLASHRQTTRLSKA